MVESTAADWLEGFMRAAEDNARNVLDTRQAIVREHPRAKVLEGLVLLRELITLHRKVYDYLSATREQMSSNQVTDMKELTNLSLIAERMRELGDDIRKESNNNRKLSDKLACMLWVTANMNNPGKSAPIKTELCTASPRVCQMVIMPKVDKQPEAYRQLMAHFGVTYKTEDPTKDPRWGVTELNWPRLQEYANNRLEEGLPLPPGFDPNKTVPDYRMTLLQKKEVDLSSVELVSVNQE